MQAVWVLAGTPWVGVGLLLVAVSSLLSATALGRRLGRSSLLAALGVASLGCIPVVTLYPAGPFSQFPQNCAGSLVAFPHVHALFGTHDGLLNVLLFLPAGVLLPLLTGRPARTAGCLVLLSFAIEVAQGVMGNHSCTSADWWANSFGALVGATVVTIGNRTARRAPLQGAPGCGLGCPRRVAGRGDGEAG